MAAVPTGTMCGEAKAPCISAPPGLPGRFLDSVWCSPCGESQPYGLTFVPNSQPKPQVLLSGQEVPWQVLWRLIHQQGGWHLCLATSLGPAGDSCVSWHTHGLLCPQPPVRWTLLLRGHRGKRRSCNELKDRGSKQRPGVSLAGG